MIEWLLMAVKFPFVQIGKLFGWFKELVAMPARVRSLEEGAAQADDPRPRCTSCGTGRVAVTDRVEQDHHSYTRGKCLNDGCAAIWRMRNDGSSLYVLWDLD